MNNKQINWASKHDWFLYSIDCGVVVVDGGKALTITDFNELKAWAGY